MLDRQIMTWVCIFVLAIFVAGAGSFFGMLRGWYAVQNMAQFVAVSQGKYGGYIIETDNAIKKFAEDMNIDPSKIHVNVSAPNDPVPWGTPVWAELNVDYAFKIGNVIEFPLSKPLKGIGRAMSSYEPGNYSVTYTYPSF